jgi:hypothetical protein
LNARVLLPRPRTGEPELGSLSLALNTVAAVLGVVTLFALAHGAPVLESFQRGTEQQTKKDPRRGRERLGHVVGPHVSVD